MAYLNTAINNSATVVDKAGSVLANASMLAIKYAADGTLALASTKGEPALGIAIAETNPVVEAGQDVSVVVKDITMWYAGAAIAKGDELTTDATGKAVPADEGEFILGIALTASTGTGDLVQVQIVKAGYKA